MAALGEKLRREREARGVSIKEIAEATRIHESYLRALEENDYGALPGTVFVTGFLRNYAVHLGLDADKIVIEFEAMKIEPPVKPLAIPGTVDEESSMSTLWAVGSLILILVIYVAYVNWPSSAPEKSEPVIDTVSEKAEKTATDKIETIVPKGEIEAVVSDADKAEPPPVKSGKTVKPPMKEKPNADIEVKKKAPTSVAKKKKRKPSPAAKKKTPPPAAKKKTPPPVVKKKEPPPAAIEKVKTAISVEPKKKEKAVQKPVAAAAPEKKSKYWLVVSAHDEDAWILVVVDDVIERDMFVRAGQRIIIKGNDSFNFTTGNARQISLTLNGKPLNFEIPTNNVLRSWDIPLPEAE